LWFAPLFAADELLIMNGINLHCLRHKSVEEKPACPGGPPVEAEGELVLVVIEMLGADGFQAAIV